MINGYQIRFKYLNYKIHYKKIKRWAQLNTTDNIYEISQWIKENETIIQKIKRYVNNIMRKIKNI